MHKLRLYTFYNALHLFDTQSVLVWQLCMRRTIIIAVSGLYRAWMRCNVYIGPWKCWVSFVYWFVFVSVKATAIHNFFFNATTNTIRSKLMLPLPYRDRTEDESSARLSIPKADPSKTIALKLHRKQVYTDFTCFYGQKMNSHAVLLAWTLPTLADCAILLKLCIYHRLGGPTGLNF